MAESIVFISHHRIKEGKLDELKARLPQMIPMLDAQKPRTVLFHAYLNADETEISFMHVFPDAEAMDLHFEGSDDRSAAAWEFMTPLDFTIYGSASEPALRTLERDAAALQAELRHYPRSLGGFIRLS